MDGKPPPYEPGNKAASKVQEVCINNVNTLYVQIFVGFGEFADCSLINGIPATFAGFFIYIYG